MWDESLICTRSVVLCRRPADSTQMMQIPPCVAQHQHTAHGLTFQRTDREALEVLANILHRQLLHRAGPRISCHNRTNASALVPAVPANGNAGKSTSAFRRRVRGSWAAAAASVASQAGTRANVVVIIFSCILRSTWENPSETPWNDWKCRSAGNLDRNGMWDLGVCHVRGGV